MDEAIVATDGRCSDEEDRVGVIVGEGAARAELSLSAAGVLCSRAASGPWERLEPGALEAKVVVDGTLNQPADRDRSWTAELAIPWRRLRAGAALSVGQLLRINLYRVEADGGRRVRLSWSPGERADGELQLGDERGSVRP